jgi:hypothetical protein
MNICSTHRRRECVDEKTVIASEAWRSLFMNIHSSLSGNYINNLPFMNRDCYVATTPRNDIITLSISPRRGEGLKFYYI